MDPLSVSAAIVGLMTAAASVTALVRKTRDAPKIARDVALEVSSISACLSQLQFLLNGTRLPSRSGTSLVMVDQVLVVLTDCVTIFSELQETLDSLKSNQQRRSFSKVRWTFKEGVIAKLLLRLQASKLSLNLMLTTLNWYVLDSLLSFGYQLQDIETRYQ